MLEFIMKYWLEFLFGLVAAGVLALFKKISDLIDASNGAELNKAIDKRLEPVLEEIKKLEKFIEEVDGKENHLQTKTIAAWGFRINQLCEIYLDQGFMTKPQYIQLVEMYNLYSQLGGNGKIKEIFDKTTGDLKIRDEQ